MDMRGELNGTQLMCIKEKSPNGPISWSRFEVTRIKVLLTAASSALGGTLKAAGSTLLQRIQKQGK